MLIDGYSARDLQPVDGLPADLIDATNDIVTAIYADRGLIYADNSFYSARLVGDVTVAQTAIDLLGMGGRIALTAANLDLWNGDRSLDVIAAQGRAAGRTIDIRTVPAPLPARSDAGGDINTAVTAFSGLVGGMSPNGRHMQVSLVDFSGRLNTPLQANFYDGNGGLGGSADLAGKPKPVSLGWRFNVSPIYLGLVDLGDGAKETYQTHWRTIAGHDAVRERGVAMAQTGSAPGIGQWRDWPSVGCFQLGFTPNGAITCDVRGDAVGGYAGSAVPIVQRMLQSLGPLLADADFDQSSLGLVATQLIGEIGWGCGTDVMTAAQAVDDLVGKCGTWLLGNRAGKIRMALPQPIPGVVNLSIDAGDIVSLQQAQMPASLQPAPSTISVTAVKNWTPLSDISSSVTGADRSALAGSGQIVQRSSDLIGQRQAIARTMSMDGLWRYEIDALRYITRLLAWLEGGLRCFQVVTDKYLDQVEIGHVCRVTYPLYGLSDGFTGVVAAWEETSSKRRLKLTLVG